ncbi:MAG: hypothetical protein R3A79_21150 [Nannocystaceae bacterium]
MDSRTRPAWPARLTSSIATLALLSLGSGCIVGFKVESSTSASAGETVDKSTVSDGSSSSGTTTGGDSDTSGDAGTGSASLSGTATEGSGATDSDGSTSGTSTSGSTSVGESTGVETTGGADVECSVDADCELFSDCCSCQAAPSGDVPAQCDLLCDIDRCEALSITAATCRFGVCVTERTGCDASAVDCGVEPPDCPAGLVAQVTEKGDCYTGECVRGIHCDAVPSCAACPDEGWSCVTNLDFVSSYRCEPIPPGCDGAPTCACAGDLYCTDIYNVCSEGGDGLQCECPDC